ncbi:MAG: ComEC/Rec2 family competence protein [Micrococcaceae bacterium]
MTSHRVPRRDAPGPIDLRLVPAAGLCLGVSLWVEQLDANVLSWLVPGLLVLAGIGLVILVLARGGGARCERATTIVGALVIACGLASLVAGHAVAQRETRILSGWEQALSLEEPVRLSVDPGGTATQRQSAFGPRWHLAGTVRGYGHPHQPLDSGVPVVLSGSGESYELDDAAAAFCVIATLEQHDGTVFAAAQQPPQPGACESSAAPVTQNLSAQSVSVNGRDQIRQALRDHTEDTIGAAPELLPGLILGDRSAQSEELDQAMKDSGLSHLSAVSGANCSLVVGVVTVLLRSARLPRPVVLTGALGTLLLFVDVVGWEPSVVRAATMGAIGAWAVFFGRGRQALPVMCLAACVLLCIAPELGREPAFQLSLAATSGIVLGARPVERWLSGGLQRVLPEPVALTVSAALAMAVCAQLACQPVLLGLTGAVNVYAVPANMLAAPLVPFITVPGTFAAFIGVMAPGPAELILAVIALPAAGIGWIAQTVARWPNALAPWPEGTLGTVLVVLHLAALCVLLLKLLRWERRGRALVVLLGRPGVVAPPQRSGRAADLLGWALIIVAMVSQAAALMPARSSSLPRDASVIVCDVGQGDMVLIRTADREAIVVDTGPDDELARRCLQENQIEAIPLVVITHLHADHVGALTAITEIAEPERVLYSTVGEPSVTTDTDTDHAGIAEEDVSGAEGQSVRWAHVRTPTQGSGSGLPATAERARTGLSGGFAGTVGGDDMTVNWTVLEANSDAVSENDASIQLLVTLRRASATLIMLMTGDMEEDATRALLHAGVFPEKVDILKVGHHGAKNGGTEIIEALDPDLFLIGVGAENTYGHPHQDIISTATRAGTVLRTDLHGSASLTLVEDRVKIDTSR